MSGNALVGLDWEQKIRRQHAIVKVSTKTDSSRNYSAQRASNDLQGHITAAKAAGVTGDSMSAITQLLINAVNANQTAWDTLAYNVKVSRTTPEQAARRLEDHDKKPGQTGPNKRDRCNGRYDGFRH